MALDLLKIAFLLTTITRSFRSLSDHSWFLLHQESKLPAGDFSNYTEFRRIIELSDGLVLGFKHLTEAFITCYQQTEVSDGIFTCVCACELDLLSNTHQLVPTGTLVDQYVVLIYLKAILG